MCVGLLPVLRDPNLALSFCYMTRIMNNRNGNVKHKTKHLVLRKAGRSKKISNDQELIHGQQEQVKVRNHNRSTALER